MDSEQTMDEIIWQRDRAQEVIDRIKVLLGIEKEWSDNYGYEEFLEEARTLIIARHGVDRAEYDICTHCGFPRKRAGMPCELCHNV